MLFSIAMLVSAGVGWTTSYQGCERTNHTNNALVISLDSQADRAWERANRIDRNPLLIVTDDQAYRSDLRAAAALAPATCEQLLPPTR